MLKSRRVDIQISPCRCYCISISIYIYSVYIYLFLYGRKDIYLLYNRIGQLKTCDGKISCAADKCIFNSSNRWGQIIWRGFFLIVFCKGMRAFLVEIHLVSWGFIFFPKRCRMFWNSCKFFFYFFREPKLTFGILFN